MAEAVKLGPASIVLLVVAAFLAPVIGGNLPNDAFPLEPGYTPTVQALFRGMEIATLQHAFIAAFVVGAFAYLVVKRKILQVPHAWISGPLAALLVILLGSVLMSSYRWTSQTALAEWMVYGLALITAVAGLGRKSGPLFVLIALVAGSSLIAIVGINEYVGQLRDGNPSWRIFAGWNNPNALAGMLSIGMLVGFGLLANARNALASFYTGAAVVVCGIALALTGSKGGVLTAAMGVLVFAVLILLWKRPRRLIGLAVCMMIIGLSAVTLPRLAKSGASGGLRVVNAGATQEQSAGFRFQLWKGALTLAKENPVGTGLATYTFYSAKPGTNTRTELTHSTWLELAVEGGWMLAPPALALLLLAWLVHAFRGVKSLPTDQNMLRAAVVAAVMATAAHGVLESNLYFFGIGLTFFLLLGVGIQLSVDAGAPEFVAPPMRYAAVIFAILCLGQLVFAGYVAKLQANARWFEPHDRDQAREVLATLQNVAPYDGETWYRSGRLARTLEEALQDFSKAVDVAPSAKFLRRLAYCQDLAKRQTDAETTLNRAVQLDPNNAVTLLQLMTLQDKAGETERAVETAKRLIATESTSYFKIRALPEEIPTETYEARLYLAKSAPDKIPLVRAAVEGFLQFGRVTLPHAQAINPDGTGVGISAKEAMDRVKVGLDAAKQLEGLYRSAGDKVGEAWASEAEREFETAVGPNK